MVTCAVPACGTSSSDSSSRPEAYARNIIFKDEMSRKVMT